MNKVSKLTDKDAYRDQWNHRTKPCLLLGGCMLKVWDIAGMKKISELYAILVVPWAGIYVLEAFESSKLLCPGDKNLCIGSQ